MRCARNHEGTLRSVALGRDEPRPQALQMNRSHTGVGAPLCGRPAAPAQRDAGALVVATISATTSASGVGVTPSSLRVSVLSRTAGRWTM